MWLSRHGTGGVCELVILEHHGDRVRASSGHIGDGRDESAIHHRQT